MLIVRRFYVYIICGASLAVLSVGLGNLLELAVTRIWETGAGGRIITATAQGYREEISLFLALVAVALPIWALHWYLAERWSRDQGERSDRGSPIRALFFMAVLGYATLAWVTSFGSVLDSTLRWALNAQSTAFDERQFINGLSIGIVALIVWGYHARIRLRDMRLTVMARHAVWPVRLVILAGAFAGLVLIALGVAELLRMVVEMIAGSEDLLAGSRWWTSNVVFGVSTVVLGSILWSIYWGYSVHVLNVADWRSESERESLLRRAFLYLVVLVGVAVTLGGVALALTEILRYAFGVEPGFDTQALWARVTMPLVTVIPFFALWASHHRIIVSESRKIGEARAQASMERVYAYVVTLISLAFTAVGVAWLSGTLIEFGIDRANFLDTDPQWAPAQIASFLSIAFVGGLVWLWHWFGLQRAAHASPLVERTSTMRRVFIYLVLTAATLAVLVALAILLYQAFQLLLGVRTAEGIGADIGYLIGIVLVAGGLLAYHLTILRGDMLLEADPDEGMPEPEYPVVRSLIPASEREFTLLLRVSADYDVDALVADLERHLPAGADLLRAVDEPGSNVEQPAVQDPVVSSEPGSGVTIDDDERTDEHGRIFT